MSVNSQFIYIVYAYIYIHESLAGGRQDVWEGEMCELDPQRSRKESIVDVVAPRNDCHMDKTHRKAQPQPPPRKLSKTIRHCNYSTTITINHKFLHIRQPPFSRCLKLHQEQIPAVREVRLRA